MAAALRPLDRPDALMIKVNKTFTTVEPSTPEAGGHQEDGEDELVGDLHIPDPESDGEGGLAQLYFDHDREYDEDEA